MILAFVVVMACSASSIFAAVRTQVVHYQHGDVVLEGYLAWDDSSDAPRPAVIVVHEWWGNNQYSRRRAEQLAQLGYVGFAIDMYGKGKITDQVKQAGEWSGQIRSNPKLAMERVSAAIDVLKRQPMVDGERLAAIGYCFGGGVVLEMARQNLPVLGVVSFHGSLASQPGAATQPIRPKILVCHGADDSFISPQELAGFKEEMRRSGADWQLIEYGGAVHAFTNPDADKAGLQGVAYNQQADRRSWQAMQNFLTELFGGK
ncbi:MAG TPA: dienelactone hydrolase family protein [Tepidisphaeraceae bacterium]|nr:dienelactone hydrolase family protein [Tepidisphaeraceae bacterium]